MNPSSFSELSMEDLLRRVRAREQGAWDALLGRSRFDLETWASRRVSNVAPGGTRPSDVSQEAALAAFQHFPSFRGMSEGEWRDWLERVLHSRFLDMIRKASTQKRDDAGMLPLDSLEAQAAPALQRSPSQASSQQESWRELLTHFYELPDDQREALSLYYLRDSTVKSIAERLDRSEEAVESLLRRGLRTLRARMEGSADAAAEPGALIAHNQTDAALSVYFRRREVGVPLELESFVADYPDCAGELRGLLHWLETLRDLQPST
jgi:RNA polymerase sigma-70 factor (ECF subfamily)